MNARESFLLPLLTGSKQFVIPIFQRDYSWTQTQCEQLLQDILRVASAPESAIHFLGSLVYIDSEQSDAVLPQWLVIDGQQRLTTCTLLMLALRDCLADLKDSVSPQDSADALEDQFLKNKYINKHELQAKLALRGLDNQWLSHELLGDPRPSDESSLVPLNLNYLRGRIPECDPLKVLKGLRRLMIVSVALKPGLDNPQLIFESLNSTGLSLTQADLVRNYVLMGHAEQLQTEWYLKYWKPLEVVFGARYRDLFDSFLRDFLTLELKAAKPIKLDGVYVAFRQWYPAHLNQQINHEQALNRLARMGRFGGYYCRFIIGTAGTPRMEECVARLRSLVDVAAPVVMVLFEHLEVTKTLNEPQFCEAINLLESYVFRRSVIGAETRSGGTIFSALASKIRSDNPLASLKAQLARFGRGKEFPNDETFFDALISEEIYYRRNCFFMLARLTNSGKEKTDLNGLTIEHVLPQKRDLANEWQEMLGEDWKNVQEVWLHRLGNLTLTAFNSEFQAKPFVKKRDLNPGGYADSPVWLNRSLAKLDTWDSLQIDKRGKDLAKLALKIWEPLKADPMAIHQAELDEAINLVGDNKIDGVQCSDYAKPMFLALAQFTRGLGEEVIELAHLKSVTYRTPAWFIELIPKSGSVYIRLAVDIADLADITTNISSANDWAFILNTLIEGRTGSIYLVDSDEKLQIAKQLIRKTHEIVMAEE